jgi:hypothetical protein
MHRQSHDAQGTLRYALHQPSLSTRAALSNRALRNKRKRCEVDGLALASRGASRLGVCSGKVGECLAKSGADGFMLPYDRPMLCMNVSSRAIFDTVVSDAQSTNSAMWTRIVVGRRNEHGNGRVMQQYLQRAALLVLRLPCDRASADQCSCLTRRLTSIAQLSLVRRQDVYVAQKTIGTAWSR